MINLIDRLMPLLAPGATLVIADIIFPTAADLERRREAESGALDDECYFITDRFLASPRLAARRVTYRQLSSCGGVIAVVRG